jgi:anti-sigma factor RsiW
MTQHILEWLPAYHDGELSPSRRQLVEKHLQDCPSCNAELQMLQGLSTLLKADPAPAFTPPQRFAAQVQLRLPRSATSRLGKNAERLPRWVLGAPLALIIVGAFLQAALWVTSIMLANNWIFGSGPFAGWLAADNMVDMFVTLSVLNIALLAGIVVLWSAWLAFWWVWKQNQNIPITTIERLEKEY